jgi:hypothetical protein
MLHIVKDISINILKLITGGYTMSKKQWYVAAELSINCTREYFIEYATTKAEAEKVLTKVKTITKLAYIDFVWKSELNLPFSTLHGQIYTKVDSILDEANKLSYNKEVVRCH